jgi:hypothetical protein
MTGVVKRPSPLIGVGIGIGVEKLARQRSIPVPTPTATPTPRDRVVLTFYIFFTRGPSGVSSTTKPIS